MSVAISVRHAAWLIARSVCKAFGTSTQVPVALVKRKAWEPSAQLTPGEAESGEVLSRQLTKLPKSGTKGRSALLGLGMYEPPKGDDILSTSKHFFSSGMTD